MNNFLFKDRDGQTPLPRELQKGLLPKNIHTMGELDEYEEQSIAEGLIWLDQRNDNCLSFIFWCKLHKQLFNNVWKWAGEIRTHELNNPDFTTPINIRPAIMQLIGDIEYWFKNSTYPKKEIIARLHEKLLTIHPFANGNGRWARILTEQICKKYKLQIPTWNSSLKNSPIERRKEYIDSIEKGRQSKDFSHLIKQIFN